MILRQSLFLLWIAVLSTPIPAQTRTEAPAFEVASVKANTANFRVERPGIRTDPSRLVATNVSLKALVILAYGIKREPVFGGPSWIDSLRFNIEAKADRAVSRDQLMLMLQKLLADRFKLIVHREKKESPVFVLVVGKNGSKLRQVEAKANPQIRFQPTGGNFRLIGEHAPMERLVDWIGSVSGRSIVLDRTGLTGVYDFELEWQPDRDEPSRAAEIGIPSDLTGASIFTAIQEQLGLKLEPKKESIQVLFVDNAEKPSEN